MLCCCGLFSVEILKGDNIKIQYRPYKYRQQLFEISEQEKEEAARVIQTQVNKKQCHENKKIMIQKLKELENIVHEIETHTNTRESHHLPSN